MISNKTKIEYNSSKIINKSSFERIEINFDSKETSKEVWIFMKECFQTKSEANIVKQVLVLLSGPLVSSEKGYFDQLKYDHIVNIAKADKSNSSNKEKTELISIKALKWQVLLVASSLPPCESSNKFVELCLNKAYETLSSSFANEGT